MGGILLQLFKRCDNGDDFSIDLLTLCFKDSSLEAEFKRTYFENNLQIGRACHLIAIFFYSVVGLWDAFVVDPSRLTVWIGVISLVTVIFLVGLASSYVALRYYAGYWQQLFAFYVLVTGSGFAFVSSFGPQQALPYNFVGIIFCLFFCYTFIRLTFLWACAAGNTIVLLYTVCVAVFTDIAFHIQSMGFFYMFGINLLGMMVCYSQELMSRRDFLLNILLKQAENTAMDLNSNLEQKVRDRTEELKATLFREKELVLKLEQEERQLKKTVDALEQAEDIARLGYFERNRETGEDYWSKGFYRLLGYDACENALSYDRFIGAVHPRDRDRVALEISRPVPANQEKNLEFCLIFETGEEVQIQGVTTTVYDNNSPLITKGIFQNVTDRKEAEKALKQMEQRLVQAQKMESIGRLAGGIAHDYNNISTIIIGYAELSMGSLDEDDPLYANFKQVHTAATRAAELTRQLLAFARKQPVAPIVIDLNESVDNMSKILSRLIGEAIRLEWLPGKNLWPVKMDPSQIDQILANLCVNSRDAIISTGKISIETKNVIFDQAYCDQNPEFTPGEYVMLAVSDDGQGMTSETLGNMFEPFFTTKGAGKGTGLGLATVYGIIKQNNGVINAYSEPGKGTTISVYLPKTGDSLLKEKTKDGIDLSSTKGYRVLLVEDDKAILELGQKMLIDLGYRVLSADTPHDALELALENRQPIHLLITDVIMPEMNGRQLADRIQKIYPDIKILFMSGYTADIIAHHGILDKGLNFLNKPFTEHSLALKLQEIFNQ